MMWAIYTNGDKPRSALFQTNESPLSHLSVELIIGMRVTAHVVVPRRVQSSTFPVLRDEETKRARRACAVGEQFFELLDAIFVLRRRRETEERR